MIRREVLRAAILAPFAAVFGWKPPNKPPVMVTSAAASVPQPKGWAETSTWGKYEPPSPIRDQDGNIIGWIQVHLTC